MKLPTASGWGIKKQIIKLDRNKNVMGRVGHNSAFLNKRGNLLESILPPGVYSDIKIT